MTTAMSKQATSAAIAVPVPEPTRWEVAKEMGRVLWDEHNFELALSAWFFSHGAMGWALDYAVGYPLPPVAGVALGALSGIGTGIVTIAVDTLRGRARRRLGLDPPDPLERFAR